MVLPDDIRDRVVSYMRHQAGKPRPEIVALVEASQVRLLDRLAGVTDATAVRAPAEGEWSLRELVRHVIDAQESVTAIVHHLGRGERPDVGRRGVGAMIDDGGEPFAALLDRLRDVNRGMLASIESLPPQPDTVLTAPHPFFGQLNCLEWSVFQRVHDEDHIQHAGKIVAALG